VGAILSAFIGPFIPSFHPLEPYTPTTYTPLITPACSFLLEPLQAVDKKRGAGQMSPDSNNPDVLVLLDALDESDDGGKGWQSVTTLVASE
jgi:hypothetical protein